MNDDRAIIKHIWDIQDDPDNPCDLTGKAYKGRYPKLASFYDGRIIEVLGWCPLTDGYEGQRRVIVRDSTNRVWSTDAGPVRVEIKRQEKENGHGSDN